LQGCSEHTESVASELPDNLFSESYFHKNCFTTSVKDMFTVVPQLLGHIPSTLEVDNRLHSKVFRPIRTPILNEGGCKSSRSSKRFRSTGETSSSASTQPTSRNGQQRQCPDCHQWLSRKTKHPSTACQSYCRRNGIAPPDVIHCGYLEDATEFDIIEEADVSDSPA